MTALLFIPATAHAPGARRIDFARMARRFAEPEAQPAPRRARGRIARIAMAILVLFGAVGDMMLVAHADPIAECSATTAQSRSL